jgi:hypothetical protein
VNQDTSELFQGSSAEELKNLDAAIAGGVDLLIDSLFEDYRSLDDAKGNNVYEVTESSEVLHKLPQQWWPMIQPVLVKQLIIAAGCLSQQLVREWTHPDTLADELLFQMLLDTMQIYVDSQEGLAMPEDWRDLLDDGFNWDHDFSSLYSDPEGNMPETAAGAVLGMAPQRLANLFDPYGGKLLAPYLVG